MEDYQISVRRHAGRRMPPTRAMEQGGYEAVLGYPDPNSAINLWRTPLAGRGNIALMVRNAIAGLKRSNMPGRLSVPGGGVSPYGGRPGIMPGSGVIR